MTEPLSICRGLALAPAGRWVVGVSGGADSVALLVALRAFRSDIEPIVVHLNHESRGTESNADAEFVAALAGRLELACVTERISVLPPVDERNLEARFRRARHALFARAVAERSADGVLLAHHADDRAETTLLRLLRGEEPTALDGLRATATVGALTIVRPLLGLRRLALETFLRDRREPWRTDATNADPRFARNRARRYLAQRSALVPELLALADAARRWSSHSDARSPRLPATFACRELAGLPAPLARAAARRWLVEAGAATVDLSVAVVERLIAMTLDRATPGEQAFPGAILVRRRGDRIEPRSRSR